MSTYYNKNASGIIKTLPGKLRGVFVSTASGSPTLQFIDGVTDNDDVADNATGTLTVSGAIVPGAHATSEIVSSGACVPADYATNTLTSDATNVAEDETVTIGAIVYRFRDTLAQAYDVKIGADAATSLANLKKAINGTGVAGTDYFAGTVAHTLVIANAITATTLQVWSRTIGTGNNALGTTETSGHLSWADTTLGGGTGASNPGVATTNATITLGSRTYTAVLNLAETVGIAAVADQILWVTSEAVFLDNLKLAVNAGAGAGTNYSTGTTAHADVIATTNTNTVQTFVARTIGTTANALATTTTLANYAWADTTFGGGTGNSNPGVATTAATVTINGRAYTFVQELTETSGASAVVDQVLHGGTTAIALDNLKLAINHGATEGTNYSTGTVVNASVTAETNTDTTQVVQAITAGTAGNSITVSETLTNGTWGVGVTTLSGGLAANVMLIEAFIGAAGTMYTFPDPDFNNGLYYRQSGTAEVTIFVD